MQNLDQYPRADDYARLALITYVGLNGEDLERPRVLACGRDFGRAALEANYVSLHHYGRVRLQEDVDTLGSMNTASVMVSVAMQPRVRDLLAREPGRPVVAVARPGEQVLEIRRPR